jgi:hypothetical protein
LEELRKTTKSQVMIVDISGEVGTWRLSNERLKSYHFNFSPLKPSG